MLKLLSLSDTFWHRQRERRRYRAGRVSLSVAFLLVLSPLAWGRSQSDCLFALLPTPTPFGQELILDIPVPSNERFVESVTIPGLREISRWAVGPSIVRTKINEFVKFVADLKKSGYWVEQQDRSAVRWRGGATRVEPDPTLRGFSGVRIVIRKNSTPEASSEDPSRTITSDFVATLISLARDFGLTIQSSQYRLLFSKPDTGFSHLEATRMFEVYRRLNLALEVLRVQSRHALARLDAPSILASSQRIQFDLVSSDQLERFYRLLRSESHFVSDDQFDDYLGSAGYEFYEKHAFSIVLNDLHMLRIATAPELTALVSSLQSGRVFGDAQLQNSVASSEPLAILSGRSGQPGADLGPVFKDLFWRVNTLGEVPEYLHKELGDYRDQPGLSAEAHMRMLFTKIVLGSDQTARLLFYDWTKDPLTASYSSEQLQRLRLLQRRAVHEFQVQDLNGLVGDRRSAANVVGRFLEESGLDRQILGPFAAGQSR
jgi:hypothetical protein